MNVLLTDKTDSPQIHSEDYDEEQLREEIRKRLAEVVLKMRLWDSAFENRNYFIRAKKNRPDDKDK